MSKNPRSSTDLTLFERCCAHLQAPKEPGICRRFSAVPPRSDTSSPISRTIACNSEESLKTLSSGSGRDLLVEFEHGHTPGLIRLASMELELARLFGDREVELRTYEDLSRYFRDEVRATATPLYDAA